MKKEYHLRNKGQVLISAILATTTLALVASGVVGVWSVAADGLLQSSNYQIALAKANTALEAIRMIRDDDFNELQPGTYGLEIENNSFTLSETPDQSLRMERSIRIIDLDDDTKEVSVTVAWQDKTGQSEEILITTRLTNWQKSVSGGGGGSSDCTGPPSQRPPECEEGNGGGPPTGP